MKLLDSSVLSFANGSVPSGSVFNEAEQVDAIIVEDPPKKKIVDIYTRFLQARAEVPISWI